MARISKFKILKNEPDPHKKEKGVFITQAISQKDALQDSTNVSLPCEENVREARNWVEHNKK